MLEPLPRCGSSEALSGSLVQLLARQVAASSFDDRTSIWSRSSLSPSKICCVERALGFALIGLRNLLVIGEEAVRLAKQTKYFACADLWFETLDGLPTGPSFLSR